MTARRLAAGACAMAAAVFLLLVSAPGVHAAGPGQLLRLHVMPNSDGAGDQALKYEVRDRILDYLKPMLEGADDFNEARLVVMSRGDDLAEIARGAVREAGYAHDIQVNLTLSDFPARTYGTTEVPAGWYWALTVTIGRGEGENWWCVLFPVLCMTAAEDSGAQSLRPVKRPRYRIALLEIISDLIRREGEQYTRLDRPSPVQGPSDPPSFPLKADPDHSLR